MKREEMNVSRPRSHSHFVFEREKDGHCSIIPFSKTFSAYSLNDRVHNTDVCSDAASNADVAVCTRV